MLAFKINVEPIFIGISPCAKAADMISLAGGLNLSRLDKLNRHSIAFTDSQIFFSVFVLEF